MNEKKDNSSKQVLLSVLGVAILVVAVVGVSFAAFTFVGTGEKENTISTGTISMTYTETSDGISITDAMPMSDAAGIALADAEGASTKNTFKFTVAATISGSTTINYEIAATKKDTSTLADSDVKLYLASVAGSQETQVMAPTHYTAITADTATGTKAGSMVLTSGTFTATQSTDYILKMWLDESYVIPNSTTAKSYSVTVNVYGKAA